MQRCLIGIVLCRCVAVLFAVRSPDLTFLAASNASNALGASLDSLATKHEATPQSDGFKVGDHVQVRQLVGNKWFGGTVTSVAPLKVNGSSWDEVRKWQPAFSTVGLVVLMSLLVANWIPCLKRTLGCTGLLDLRSLGLGRILCGLILLSSWWQRSEPEEVKLLYSDTGLLPCSIITASSPTFEFACTSGITFGQTYFRVGMLLAACVTAGFFTTATTFGSSVLLCLLNARNKGACYSCGDCLLYILFFWSNFVPWGKCFSVDRMLELAASKDKRDASASESYSVSSPGAFGLAVQVAIAYLGAATNRVGPEWVGPEYTAVSLAMHVNNWSSPLGKLLGDFPLLCAFLTRMTMIVELSAPWLLLLPMTPFTQYFRFLGIAMLAGFMASLWCCMRLNIIPYVFIAAVCCLLPSVVWDRWNGKAPKFPIQQHEAHRCEADTPAEFVWTLAPLAKQALAFAFLVCMIADASSIDMGLPSSVDQILRDVTKPRVHWGMFGSNIDLYEFWITVDGELQNGNVVQFGDGNPDRTQSFGAGFNNSYYLSQIVFSMNSFESWKIADYCCRTWSSNASAAAAWSLGKMDSPLQRVHISVVGDKSMVSEDKLHVSKTGPQLASTYDFACHGAHALAYSE